MEMSTLGQIAQILAVVVVLCCAVQERLKSCTEHNQAVKEDAAAAAKLRMAVAAALQPFPRLQAAAGVAGSSSKGRAQQQLLQGLDAAGVAVYVDQLLEELVAAVNAAAAAAGCPAGANGSGASEVEPDSDGSTSEDLEDDEAAGAGGWVVGWVGGTPQLFPAGLLLLTSPCSDRPEMLGVMLSCHRI
jgi:hypothetical protein